MNTETTTTRTTRRTRFGVAELAHAYFNRIATDGASAGTDANVSGTVLCHTGAIAAAAFLHDAHHPDGRPVVVICPQYASSDARWSTTELRAAVPATTLHAVQLSAWPSRSTAAFGYLAPGAVRTLFYRVMDAATVDLLGGHASANTHVRDLAALLELRWADPVDHERARVALRDLREEWQLYGPDPSAAFITAHADRLRDLRHAREGFVTLADHARRRDALAPQGARIATAALADLVRSTATVERLDTALSRVARAGIDTHGLDVGSIVRTARADYARVSRYNSVRAAVRYYYHREWPGGYNGLYPATDAAPQVRRLATLLQERDARDNARAYRLDRVAQITRVLAAVDLIPATIAACRDLVALNQIEGDDVLLNALSLPHVMPGCSSPLYGTDIAQSAKTCLQRCVDGVRALHSRVPTHPRLRDPLIASVVDLDTSQWSADLRELAGQLDALGQRAKGLAAAVKLRRQRDDFRDRVNTVTADPTRMPRDTLRRIEMMLSQLSGYQSTQCGDEHTRPLLRQQLADAQRAAILACETVSARQEWHAGGAAPDGGDWLRVGPARCTSSRGAVVATSAVRRTLRWLDAQPDVEARPEAPIDLSGYAFYGRNEDGSVVVGCHRFSAEAVADLREQLDALPAADAADAADAA